MKKKLFFGKKSLTKAMCIVLAGLMVASLGGCKKKQNAGTGVVASANDVSASKENVFRLIGEGSTGSAYFSNAIVCDDQVILVTGSEVDGVTMNYEPGQTLEQPEETEEVSEDGSENPSEETDGNTEEKTSENTEDTDTEDTKTGDDAAEEFSHTCSWTIVDYSGNVIGNGKYDFNRKADTDLTYSDAAINANGNLVVANKESHYDMNTGNQAEKYILTELTLDGNLVSSAELELPEHMTYTDATVAKDCVYVYVDTEAVIFDFSGNQIGNVSAGALANLSGVLVSDNGRVFFRGYDNNYNLMLLEYFPDQKNVGNPIEGATLGDFSYVFYTPGKEHDLTMSDNNILYSVDVQGTQATATPIMNFMDSDVLASYTTKAYLLDDTHVLLVDYDDSAVKNKFEVYEKVPADQVKEKAILTVGGPSAIDNETRKMILAFNKKHDDVRLRTVDYEKYSTEADPLGSQTQFNTDLLNHCGPDIIVTSMITNPAMYFNKSVFVDLYPLMEANGINKDDYLSNILESGGVDGKCYILNPSFMVYAMAIKESYLGGKEYLSVSEIKELEKKLGCEGRAVAGANPSYLLDYLVAFSGDTYYNAKTGECSFDSPEFIEALEWIKTCEDTELDYENYESSAKKQIKDLHDGKHIFTYVYLTDFRGINTYDKSTYGEKVAFTGFPGSNTGSGVIYAPSGLAISNDCKDKELAFEFVKSYLSDDYQYIDPHSYSYRFPISKKALQQYAMDSTQKPYEQNIRTGAYEQVDERSANVLNEVITPISEERAQEVIQYLESCNLSIQYDDKIGEMVKEECEPFFAGQKSAQECASILQSRISIYVKEQN